MEDWEILEKELTREGWTVQQDKMKNQQQRSEPSFRVTTERSESLVVSKDETAIRLDLWRVMTKDTWRLDLWWTIIITINDNNKKREIMRLDLWWRKKERHETGLVMKNRKRYYGTGPVMKKRDERTWHYETSCWEVGPEIGDNLFRLFYNSKKIWWI